ASADPLLEAQTDARRLSEFQLTIHRMVHRYESIDATLRAAARVPDYLGSISAVEFERLLVGWFEWKGYNVLSVSKGQSSSFDFAIESPKHSGLVLVEAKKMSPQSR